MKIIFRNIRGKEYIYLALTALLVALQVRLDLLFPEYLRTISALLQVPEAVVFEMILPSCLKMLAVALAGLACGVCTAFCITRMSTLIVARIREQTFNKVIDLSQKEIGEFTIPSLLSRCNFDIQQVRSFIILLPQVVVRAPMTGIIAAVKLSTSNFTWTAIVLAVLVITICFIVLLVRSLTSKMNVVNRLTDKLNRVSMEHITGLRVIHSYNAYGHQQKRFEDVNHPLTDMNIDVNSRMAMMYPVLTFMQSIGGVLIYLSGAYMIEAMEGPARQLLFSDMIVAYYYSGTVMISFMMVAIAMIQLPRMILSTKRINEVLDSPVSIEDGEGDVPEKTGTVEFRHVNFRYPQAAENALEDISFKAERGQTVAFIGSTGCGKTSIMNLIPRIYDVTGGEILVDGLDVREFRLHDLRERIGYVPQKNTLFKGTISENIAYGDEERSEEEIRKAAGVGQADEFIAGRPGGYDAVVEHGGGNFSGGQKQRLAIARAVCKNPEIYLFDDSFSALDLVTDRKVRENLRRNSNGATILIAAQRISTIIDADKILVIDRGRVIAEGRHRELMETCGLYQEIAKSQMGQD